MIRRALLTFLSLLAIFSTSTVSLDACGDKFLRIGRSPRYAYAAAHRASILLYVPAKAKASTVNEYAAVLKRAGHRPVSVRDMGTFSSALAGGKYDIVIAILPDAALLRELAAAAQSKPDVLPIVSKPTETGRIAITRQYGHLLEAGASKHETLTEIDHVMEVRLKQPALTSASPQQ